MANLPIIPPTLTPGYCFESWQQIANDLVGGATVQLDVAGAQYLLNQTVTPSVTQHGFLWRNPNTGHILDWNASQSSWTMRHPESAGSDARRIYVGTLASIDTYDGGSTATVNDIAGPMWAVDPLFAQRFPVGVGTFPLSAAVIAVGATGGLDQLTLLAANLPAVKIAVNTAIIGQGGVGSPEPVVGQTYGSTPIAGAGRAVDGTSTDLSGRYFSHGETDDLGLATPIASVPPYLGVYFLKRTNRIYWTS